MTGLKTAQESSDEANDPKHHEVICEKAAKGLVAAKIKGA